MEIARLRVSFPMKLTEDEEVLRTDVYWEHLSEYSIEAVVKAMRRAINECRWFPTVSELIDFISEDAEKVRAKSIHSPVAGLLENKGEAYASREDSLKFFRELNMRLEARAKELNNKRAEEFEEKRRAAKKQAELLLAGEGGEA